MQITITKKAYWGSLCYFTFYKNGVRQGKIFTNVPVKIDVKVGDVLTFQEGWLQLPRKVEILPDTKEITIVNKKQVPQLFFLCLMLFITLSLLFLSIQTFSRFVLAEVSAYIIIQWFFKQQRYHFVLRKQPNYFAPYT
jgi:hypothetical protein